jgi:peroxiredoxin
MIRPRRIFTRFGLGTMGLALFTAGFVSNGLAAQGTPKPAMAQMQTNMDVKMVPKEGQKAPDFALTTLDGTTVRLSTEVARGPVVLVVLRGWPGYQCPFCTRQFGEYMGKAPELAATGSQVLFVYPGPADGLQAHAEAFTKTAPLPANYRVLLDPDYSFTQAYNLRWNAPHETAYPSTFVINKGGVITFARSSHTHGDRVPVADVLAALAQHNR